MFSPPSSSRFMSITALKVYITLLGELLSVLICNISIDNQYEIEYMQSSYSRTPNAQMLHKRDTRWSERKLECYVSLLTLWYYSLIHWNIFR